jgi:hypothetical protein
VELGFECLHIYIRSPLPGLDGLSGPNIYRGRPYNVTASVNVFIEAVALQ